jgi:hypothetical protein
MLTPTIPDTSSYRLMYEGPCGVSGISVPQLLDLTGLSYDCRTTTGFEDNFRVFVRPKGVGVSNVSPNVDFVYASGVPTAMVMYVTAGSPNDEFSVEAWYVHSMVR